MLKIITTSLLYIIFSANVITVKVFASSVEYREEKAATNIKPVNKNSNIISSELIKGDVSHKSQQQHHNALKISSAWARASLPSNNNSAAYMSIHNNTDKQITILGVSASSIADNIQLHKSFIDEKGIGRMASVDKIVLPAKSLIDLSPGGIHIMLFDLKSRLNLGDSFKMTFELEDMDPITIDVKVGNKK